MNDQHWQKSQENLVDHKIFLRWENLVVHKIFLRWENLVVNKIFLWSCGEIFWNPTHRARLSTNRLLLWYVRGLPRQDHKKILWWVWGLENIHHETTRKSCGGVGIEKFHHKTTRKSCGGGKGLEKVHHKTTRIYSGLVVKHPHPPQDFLVVLW